MNKQKIILTTAIVTMVVLSLVLASIMAKNMNKEDSKLRTQLTKDYKEYKDKDFSYDEQRGSQLYKSLCMSCHGDNGQGVGVNPALFGRNVMEDDKQALLDIVLNGKGNMPKHFKVPHEDMAHVLTYIKNEFTSSDEQVTPLDIVIFKVKSLDKGQN